MKSDMWEHLANSTDGSQSSQSLQLGLLPGLKFPPFLSKIDCALKLREGGKNRGKRRWNNNR
jgi:hypothetical protein